MKKTLINTLCELMKEKENIFLLTADLGFGAMDRLIEEYPHNFINVGICEQILISAAAGMALEGNIVFVYSIGNFPTLRCLEQIRNDVAYHNVNVKIIGVGGGFAYGSGGMSHHATEDIAVMRAIPGMTVLAPADCFEAKQAVQLAVETDGPVYIRLGRGGEQDIKHKELDINKAMLVEEKKCSNTKEKVAILGIGTIMKEVEEAVSEAKKIANISAYSIPKIKPIDDASIIEICQKNDYIITVEEHNVIGGLGSTIAEIIAENNIQTRLLRMGLKEQFSHIVGTSDYLRKCYKLDSKSIVENIEYLIKGKK